MINNSRLGGSRTPAGKGEVFGFFRFVFGWFYKGNQPRSVWECLEIQEQAKIALNKKKINLRV